MNKIVIGIDYGTDSCRALVVDTDSGKEIASHVAFYPRWRKGLYCNPSNNQYRQHPQDYIDSLEEAVHGALEKISGEEIRNIMAIGIDTTGSTPCLTDKNGMPLALLQEYSEDPDAMFILWKDHTSIEEANDINKLAHEWETDYTSLSGGIYSSEWFWAKALHVLRKNEKVCQEAHAVIEHCDWMPAMLTGILKPEKVKRSRCAAGHKAMWAEDWGGYPSKEYFTKLNPALGHIREHLSNQTYTSDKPVGKITKEWADKLGVPEHVLVSVGILDAHAGAIGAGIKEHTMVKIIGTSTCDIVVASKDVINSNVPGISGQVDGSVLPDMIGLEAGQSAFGDVYAWFNNLLSWPLQLLPADEKDTIISKILPKLTEEAQQIPITEDSIVSLDWLNGRRTPFVDFTKKGIIKGITLSTTAAQIFKSLVEATAFGSKAILDHFKDEGIVLNEVIGVGGISRKSDYVMQTLSDVMRVPIKVAATDQAGALGVAMSAAVAAGIFENLSRAQIALGKDYDKVYYPNEKNRMVYDKLYSDYLSLSSIT